MAEGFSGRCLCGAVQYRSTADPHLVGQCHCVDCRKTSATDHAIHLIIAEDALTVSGEVAFYDHPADSGNTVSRGFCPKCASAIYSRNSGMPGDVFVRVSSLDDLEIAKPQVVVFTSRAPSWSHIDPDLPAFPEMPDKRLRPTAETG